MLAMTKIGALRALILDLLREHETDGAIPTSARFLFYELIQRKHLSKEQTGARRADQNLHDALTDVRESGQVPWRWIVDETRSLDDYIGSPSIKQGMPASPRPMASVAASCAPTSHQYYNRATSSCIWAITISRAARSSRTLGAFLNRKSAACCSGSGWRSPESR
jgi:hypothetical protein